jgi:hypothetical protein
MFNPGDIVTLRIDYFGKGFAGSTHKVLRRDGNCIDVEDSEAYAICHFIPKFYYWMRGLDHGSESLQKIHIEILSGKINV